MLWKSLTKIISDLFSDRFLFCSLCLWTDKLVTQHCLLFGSVACQCCWLPLPFPLVTIFPQLACPMNDVRFYLQWSNLPLSLSLFLPSINIGWSLNKRYINLHCLWLVSYHYLNEVLTVLKQCFHRKLVECPVNISAVLCVISYRAVA